LHAEAVRLLPEWPNQGDEPDRKNDAVFVRAVQT